LLWVVGLAVGVGLLVVAAALAASPACGRRLPLGARGAAIAEAEAAITPSGWVVDRFVGDHLSRRLIPGRPGSSSAPL